MVLNFRSLFSYNSLTPDREMFYSVCGFLRCRNILNFAVNNIGEVR